MLLVTHDNFLYFFVCNSKFTQVQSSHLIFTGSAVHAAHLWARYDYDTERPDLINISTNTDCHSVQCKAALAWKLQQAPCTTWSHFLSELQRLERSSCIGTQALGWWALWVEECLARAANGKRGANSSAIHRSPYSEDITHFPLKTLSSPALTT